MRRRKGYRDQKGGYICRDTIFVGKWWRRHKEKRTCRAKITAEDWQAIGNDFRAIIGDWEAAK